MRSVLVPFAAAFVVGLTACAAEESPRDQTEPPPREQSSQDRPPNVSPGGGTPSNLCGEAPSGSAVGCGLLDVANGRYCSDYRTSPSSAGKCLAPVTTGTMTATIGGSSFAAALVGARRLSPDLIEIAGLSAPNASSSEPSEPGEGLRIIIGTTASGSCYSVGFTETRTGPVWFVFADAGTCTYELTDDGTTGTVTGTFVATLRQSALADAPSRDVTGGAFSVKLSP